MDDPPREPSPVFKDRFEPKSNHVEPVKGTRPRDEGADPLPINPNYKRNPHHSERDEK